MRAIPVLALLAVALTACTPPRDGVPASTSANVSRHPVSGLTVIPLTVTTKDGSAHRFAVEVARSDAEQARGLMFRTYMGADEGMLFPRNPPDMAVFWMKNTVLSLDLLFIGKDRRVINVAANAVPYSETPLPSFGPAAAVVELNGGRAAELGIEPGDRVEW